MKPISKYTASAAHQMQTEPHDKLPIELITMVFSRMQGKYPHKWKSAYPNPRELKIGMAAWEITLAGLDISDIERGFSQWHGEWPPSDEEFLEACRLAPVLAAHKQYNQLPRPEPKIEVVEGELQKMREAIKGR